MKYSYKAKRGIKTIEGAIDADSQTQAISKLEAQGLLPVLVELQRAAHDARRIMQKRISSRDINTDRKSVV